MWRGYSCQGAVVYRGEFDPHVQALYEWHASGQTYLNSHKFTGYERDWATNLDDAKARTYHHNRGRFMQPDPLGLGAADVTDPQSLNLYSYVQNDPVNFVDPSGLKTIVVSCIKTPDGVTECEIVDIFGDDMGTTQGAREAGKGGGGGGGGGGGRQGGGQQGNTAQKSSFSDCFEKYRFTSTVGALFGDKAESVAKVIDTTSTISLAGDVLATAVKASGKTLGSPQPYASGLNWVFRRISSGSIRGVLTSIGNKITPVLAVTAAFTAGYDLSIAAQCASGLL